jgi:hypothetical protein
MTTVLAGSARPRQTFFDAGVASKVGALLFSDDEVGRGDLLGLGHHDS